MGFDLPFRRQSAQIGFSCFRMSSMSNFSFSSAISNGLENELKWCFCLISNIYILVLFGIGGRCLSELLWETESSGKQTIMNKKVWTSMEHEQALRVRFFLNVVIIQKNFFFIVENRDSKEKVFHLESCVCKYFFFRSFEFRTQNRQNNKLCSIRIVVGVVFSFVFSCFSAYFLDNCNQVLSSNMRAPNILHS